MIDLKPASARLTELLAYATDERFADPTPCAEYSVAELLGHIDTFSLAFVRVARGAHRPGARGVDAEVEPLLPRAGEPWLDTIAGHVTALGDAWADPAAWDGESDTGIVLPNATWGRIALTELVVHGWDLARAVGRAYVLDDASLAACLEHVEVFVPKAPLPDLWGPPVDVPEGAPTIDRIVAITGRTP